MPRWLTIVAVLLMLSGCASETTRYRMPASEGQYTFIGECKKGQEEALQLASAWVDATFHPQKIQKHLESAASSLQLKAWAPVTVYGQEQSVEFQMTCTFKDNKFKLHFVTGSLPNGLYPSQSNLSQLESYYGGLRDRLRKFLEQPPAL